VEANLDGAQARLTGTFKDSYAALVRDVVIPGARQQRISAEARIAAAAPGLADARHAVVLVFVNQTTTIGGDPPSDTASSVRVALDNVNGRWLISQFDPI
jgi:Mce-associated membrane protein